MRTSLTLLLFLSAIVSGCNSSPAVGPGVVTITESTTSTSTSTTTTTTTALRTTAAIVFSPVTPEACQTVNFNGANSTPGTNRQIASYSWDFGDGVKKTGVTATHDYFPSGVYLATLTVTDNLGGTDTKSEPVTVRPLNPPATVCP